MNEKLIEMAREAGLGAYLAPNWQLNEELEHFANLVQADMKAKYDKLLDEYEKMANQAIFNNDFKTRLADAIQQMPFGDTASSFATFVREFK